ncbi:hypothetical protein [uncultured Algibacter sp.]|uniref:hypothetical protein n=1 Tax=uncultured Algibacter sp. TaxID=298659 RepID=UPI003217A113
MKGRMCPTCKNESLPDSNICEKCEFPFNGTEKEKSIHIGRFIGKKGIIIDSEDSLTKSQNLLYFAAGFYILGVIINFSLLLNNIFTLLLNITIIIIIAGSGILLKKSPLLFLIIPLAVLLTLYIFNFIINPNTLFEGIIFKLLILSSLFYSIYNYISSEKFKKKYNF